MRPGRCSTLRCAPAPAGGRRHLRRRKRGSSQARHRVSSRNSVSLFQPSVSLCRNSVSLHQRRGGSPCSTGRPAHRPGRSPCVAHLPATALLAGADHRRQQNAHTLPQTKCSHRHMQQPGSRMGMAKGVAQGGQPSAQPQNKLARLLRPSRFLIVGLRLDDRKNLITSAPCILRRG